MISAISSLIGDSNFLGIIYSRVEDNGPKIAINLTKLSTNQAFILTVHSVQLFGSSFDWKGFNKRTISVFGPVPNQSSGLSNSLLFPFVMPDLSSHDPRVRQNGRSCLLLFLFDQQMIKYDTIRQFLDNQLSKWVASTTKITNSVLQRLSKTITQFMNTPAQISYRAHTYSINTKTPLNIKIKINQKLSLEAYNAVFSKWQENLYQFKKSISNLAYEKNIISYYVYDKIVESFQLNNLEISRHTQAEKKKSRVFGNREEKLLKGNL